MKIKTRHLVVFVVIASFLAAFLFPGVGDNQNIKDLITFIGILFGIIVGFFIADLYSRYQGIRNNAGIDASCLATFYFYATIIEDENEGKNKEWLAHVEDRTEEYIKHFMPLPWDRYSETEKDFEELGMSLKELEYTGDKSSKLFASMLSVYNQQSEAREKLVMYGKDKLSWGEWLTIVFLGVLLLSSLFYIKDSSIISSLFTGAITAAIVLLFVVLKDLNNLNFGENAVSVEPYERVLDTIGKPRVYMSKRRAII